MILHFRQLEAWFRGIALGQRVPREFLSVLLWSISSGKVLRFSHNSIEDDDDH